MADLTIRKASQISGSKLVLPLAAPAAPRAVEAKSALGQDAFIRTSPVAVTSRYAGLTEADKRTYDELRVSLNPGAQNSLARLLESGKLKAAQDLREGHDLLFQLARLYGSPLPTELNPRRFVSALVMALENPGKIQQGAWATCPVTTAEYMVATRAPAEYARIVTDLVISEGAVVLADGALIKRAPDSLKPDQSGRMDHSRLFQAAMSDYGNGFLSYDNQKDASMLGSVAVSSGLSNSATLKVINSLFNEHYKIKGTLMVLGMSPIGSSRLVTSLEGMLKKNGAVPVALDWRLEGELLPSPHEVMALKIENGRFYFRNPQGNYMNPGTEMSGKSAFFGGPPRRIEDALGVESMPLENLPKRLTSIMVKDGL